MTTDTNTAANLSRLNLKGFKSVKWMSEETICFTATVILDGKVIGEASNEGRGGSTFTHFVSPEAKAIAEAFAKSISPADVKGWEFLSDKGFDFDCLVDILVERRDAADHIKKTVASIRRKAAKECMIINADMSKGQYKSFAKAVKSGAPIAACAAKAKEMGYTIVSEMSDEAIAAHFAA